MLFTASLYLRGTNLFRENEKELLNSYHTEMDIFIEKATEDLQNSVILVNGKFMGDSDNLKVSESIALERLEKN